MQALTRVAFFAFVLACCLTSAGADANAIYHYEGADLTPSVFGGVPAGVTHLSGDLILASVLAPNLSSAAVPVLDFSLGEGTTIAGPGGQYFIDTPASGGSIIGSALFSTDSSGDITDWAFIVAAISYRMGLTELISSGTFGDQADYCINVDCTLGAFATSRSPGSWTVSPVPIPAALWLLGSALGVLGVIRRRS